MQILGTACIALIALWGAGFLGYYLHQHIKGDHAVDRTLELVPRDDAPLMFHLQTVGYIIAIIASVGLLLLVVLGGRG